MLALFFFLIANNVFKIQDYTENYFLRLSLSEKASTNVLQMQLLYKTTTTTT